MCPYQRSLLSFRMRSRSEMPSSASSSVDLMVAVSRGFTLQICLIIALSFRCRRWRLGFVNGQVSLVHSYLKKKNCNFKWFQRFLNGFLMLLQNFCRFAKCFATRQKFWSQQSFCGYMYCCCCRIKEVSLIPRYKLNILTGYIEGNN